jgi:hypothetical protein
MCMHFILICGLTEGYAYVIFVVQVYFFLTEIFYLILT